MPMRTVSVVLAAGWFAAAAVNQCLALSETLNLPGWFGERSLSVTFCKPSVSVLNCQRLPDAPTGASAPTRWAAIVAVSVSASETVTGSLV